MCAILNFDFKKKKKETKRKQLHFSEENYVNYTKKTKINDNYIFPKHTKVGETRTSSGPMWIPLRKCI